MAQLDSKTNESLHDQSVKSQVHGKRCNRRKICISCSVFLAVVAVATPVGVFVVGPKIAQAAIDMSSFHIANNTIYNIPSDPSSPGYGTGMFSNVMTLHSPIFLPAVIHDINVTMVLNTPNATFDDMGFTDGPIGWFTQPKAYVVQGDNHQEYDVPVTFNMSADAGYRFMGWSFWVVGSQVAYIDLVAEPKVTALGFLTYTTKMKKTIACNCINNTWCGTFPKPEPTPEEVPNSTWYNDDAFYRPFPDNATTLPTTTVTGATTTTLTKPPFYYLPTLTLFCQPVGTSVFAGNEIMPKVAPTTTDMFSGVSV